MRRISSSIFTLAMLGAAASCGSRTGLLVSALEPGPDAAVAVVDDAPACIPGRFPLSQAKPELMFVLDRSASMEVSMTTENGLTSRWSVLEVSLTEALTPFNDEVAMGARFFPGPKNDFGFLCNLDPMDKAIKPSLGNVPKILDVFARTGPFGSTPTSDALKRAADEFSSSRSRALVLTTDGAPNCNAALDPKVCTCSAPDPDLCSGNSSISTNCLDDARTVQTIATIADSQKIPVYVIGIGVATRFTSTLDAMAVAGRRPRAGSPKYYMADTPAQLTEAFMSIRDSVVRCSYTTESVPGSPDAMSVEVGGRVVSRDPSHLEGWDWTDQAYGQLQLFGLACMRATATNVSGTAKCAH